MCSSYNGKGRRSLNYGDMRSVLFWDLMLRSLVIPYRLFGTTHQSHLQGASSPSRSVLFWDFGVLDP
jgi:hypothetical protein